MKVERHPGPFVGPDAELARACAMAAIPFYGNDDGITHQRIMKDGIWNDHIAVQAALAAIHHLKTVVSDEIDRDNPEFNRGVTHTVELLAKALGVTDWVAGDGSEDYDEDLQQTLMNIIEAKGLYSSENGEWAALTAGHSK